MARFPGVRLIRQDNRGLAAARNAGLTALDTSLRHFSRRRRSPRAARHRGGAGLFRARAGQRLRLWRPPLHRRDGNEIGERFEPPGESPYLHLLRAQLHRHARHGDVPAGPAGGGRRLRRAAAALRGLRRLPAHGAPVSDRRLPGSRRGLPPARRATCPPTIAACCAALLDVHASHAPPAATIARARAAWSEGRRRWRRYYAEEMARAPLPPATAWRCSLSSSLAQLARIAAVSPQVAAARGARRRPRRRVAALLPRHLAERLLRRPRSRAAGRARAARRSPTGSPRSASPSASTAACRSTATTSSAFSRGMPQRSSDACSKSATTATPGSSAGRVSRGATCCTSHAGNPRATFVGDVTDPRVLPDNAFDCIIFTQTLQLIYDVRAAVVAAAPRARAGRRGAGHRTRHQPDRSGRMGQDLVLVLHADGDGAAVRRGVRR